MRTIDERTAGVSEYVAAAMEGTGASVRVALPGIVTDWDADQQTVSVQLAICEKVARGGTVTEMAIPQLVDVPVVMPRAGGYSLVFAPAPGDECLVVFSDLCIDSWWQSGGVQSQAESRRHDLSDGFAIMGCWSQSRMPSIPASGVSLQNDDGTAGVSISDNIVEVFGYKIRIQNEKGTSGISISASSVNLFGTVLINGSSYYKHRHGGVLPGDSTTDVIDLEQSK